MEVRRIGGHPAVSSYNKGVKKATSHSNIDTSDKVVKSHTESGFFSKIKKFVKENIVGTSTKESTSKDYGSVSVARSAAIGATVGGAAGAVTGYTIASNIDPSQLPEKSVELEWSEPVMEKRYIGDIPRDYYQPIDHPDKSVGKEIETAFKVLGQSIRNSVDPTRPVYADAPKVAPGGEGIMMVQKQELFEGRGEPHITWQEKSIEEPYLAGYKDNPVKDVSSKVIGHTPDGTPVEQQTVDGIYHKFTPDIRYQEVGTYKVPHVEFKGPDPWEYAGMGLAIGAMGGTVLGALVAALRKMAKG